MRSMCSKADAAREGGDICFSFSEAKSGGGSAAEEELRLFHDD